MEAVVDWSKKFGRIAATACFLQVLSTAPANAITINAEQYNEVLAVDVGIALGVWSTMGKFMTGILLAPTVSFAPITGVPVADPSLAGQTFNSLTAMGNFDPIQQLSAGDFHTTLLSSGIELNNPSGTSLLTTALSSPGSFNISFSGDTAGNLQPTALGGSGLFNVTGGTLASLAIFQNGPLYVTFESTGPFWNIGNGNDIYANTSRFRFYARSGSHEEVPEPATALLIGAGLVSAKMRRRRKH